MAFRARTRALLSRVMQFLLHLAQKCRSTNEEEILARWPSPDMPRSLVDPEIQST
jgi:hypothetical protein